MAENYYKKKREGPHVYTVELSFQAGVDTDNNPWYNHKKLHIVAMNEEEAKDKAEKHVEDNKIDCEVGWAFLGTRGVII